MPWLLLAFIVVPIIELVVIGQIWDVLGGWPTVGLLFLDSLVGAILVRREGVKAWRRFRSAIEDRRWPGDEVTQGGLVLVGGALLLTPGFVTDAVGLAMVAPPTRALLSRAIRSRMRSVASNTFGVGGAARQEGSRGGDVLDVEVMSVERDEEPPASDGQDEGGRGRSPRT